MTALTTFYGDWAERMLRHVEGRTTDQASGIMTVPTGNHVDPARWEREMDRIFKRVPLMLALSINLPQANDCKAMQALDQMCDFFFNAVEAEDHQLSRRVQKGLNSGAVKQQTFSRNEPGNPFFHKWVEYFLGETGRTPAPVMRA